MKHPIPTRTLADGLIIPQIGFGTVYFKGAEGVKIINNALNKDWIRANPVLYFLFS